jgi:hypothetical protein
MLFAEAPKKQKILIQQKECQKKLWYLLANFV